MWANAVVDARSWIAAATSASPDAPSRRRTRSAVLGVREVEAAPGVPERALVAVRRHAARLLAAAGRRAAGSRS